MPLDSEALAKIAAAGFAGVFAGAATFISAVQHPALVATEDHAAQARYFAHMYPNAARMQATGAVLSGISALAVHYLQRDKSTGHPLVWLASGCAMVALVPYTLAAMLPLNKQLKSPARCLAEGPAWVRASLKRWATLHSVRTGTSLAAFTAMLAALASETVERPDVPIQVIVTAA